MVLAAPAGAVWREGSAATLAKWGWKGWDLGDAGWAEDVAGFLAACAMDGEEDVEEVLNSGSGMEQHHPFIHLEYSE